MAVQRLRHVSNLNGAEVESTGDGHHWHCGQWSARSHSGTTPVSTVANREESSQRGPTTTMVAVAPRPTGEAAAPKVLVECGLRVVEAGQARRATLWRRPLLARVCGTTPV